MFKRSPAKSLNWKSITMIFRFIVNMGCRYVLFRGWYVVQKQSGLLKKRFPVNEKSQDFLSLDEWRMLETKFFFEPGVIKNSDFGLGTKPYDLLKTKAENISQNRFQFFGNLWFTVPDWHTNPRTGFEYDRYQHWTGINDFSEVAGDIKFVWEKSRFTFLYDLIRYDFHFQESQAENVFCAIEDWIKMNPENCGPNWVCSQEIAVRVLNWTFALYYYQNAAHLSNALFSVIVNSIYQQMKHVESNLAFSRIAVRNNHVLTESLALFLVGMLYPFFPESNRWEQKGRKVFETEIAFQTEPDGTYCQFSMNYHRVVVQLLSWAIRLAELNGRKWNQVVYDRARASLRFLTSVQDQTSGWLPNYGNNDGALFFPLTDCYFRDFRPQLYALSRILGQANDVQRAVWEEESDWYFGYERKCIANSQTTEFSNNQCVSFPDGGYQTIRDADTLTVLSCRGYSRRPFQADNNHLDIWVKGENILRDAGTYLYNTEEKWLNYFSGTASHNTVMIGNFDQMTRGPRFIWHDWIKFGTGEAAETRDKNILEGRFIGFRALGKNIMHRRKVVKTKEKLHWTVEDWLENVPTDLPIYQIWHPNEYFFQNFIIEAFETDGSEIPVISSTGWFSEGYGVKKEVGRLLFTTKRRYIKTIITAKPSLEMV